MLQQIINAIIPIAITAIVSGLLVVIKNVGDAAINFLIEKASAAKTRAGSDKYETYLALARSAWNIVDEYFRITPTVQKTISNKQAKFAEELKKLIPAVTDSEIESLRQAIAGEVNKGKAAITSTETPAEDAKQENITKALNAVMEAAKNAAQTISTSSTKATSDTTKSAATANSVTDVIHVK